MRLIQVDEDGRLTLVEYDDSQSVKYAILSHTWGSDSEEVTFKDFVEGTGKNKAGYGKIDFCVNQIARDDLKHFWIDTCCIDKSSSAELSEAINSMFRWYRDATVCYVYLSDVSASDCAPDSPSALGDWEAAFCRSRWFTRGWTLQELIAPVSVQFFSKEGNLLGSRTSLESSLQKVTGIAIEVLQGQKSPVECTVEERFSWATQRNTRRPEDKAYSLLGLFNVFMPLLYGEGEDKALKRLREEITKSLKGHGAHEPSISPSSMVPFRADKDFIDRKMKNGSGTFLEHIERLCTPRASRVALVGIGGSGKSQLAIEHCHRLRARSPATWIFWIHASNAERIEQGYRGIAEQVRIPGREDPQNNIFDLVTRWLRDERNGEWLLVLDNADDDTVIFASQALSSTNEEHKEGQRRLARPLSVYLPQCVNGMLLVTTRTKSVASKLVEPDDMVMIEPMTSSDAVALLKKKLKRTNVDRDLEELAKILEYMPLALVQAAAFMQQRGTKYQARRYIQEFERSDKRQMSLLDYEAGHLRRDPEAKNSIIVTWQISFDYLRMQWPSSSNLLALMSFFDRQGIPKEALIGCISKDIQISEDKHEITPPNRSPDQDLSEDSRSSCSSEDALERLEEDIDRLQNYSFVSTSIDEQTLEMHRLVQLATRKWLSMHKQEERWKGQFYQKLDAVFPDSKFENWRKCERLFPHAKAAERQQPKDNSGKLEWSRILYKAANYIREKGNYDEAEKMDIKSVEGCREVLGEEHPETLISMNNLAATYLKQGRWTKAEQILLKVLKTFKRVLGEEDINTLTSMANLAFTYSNQGRWKEAEQKQVEVLQLERRVLGEEHPDTLESRNNLGGIYLRQGRWIEAEKLQLEVLQLRKKVLGKEHPGTLISMNNLAFTYSNQGRWTEAEKIQLEVLQLESRVLGEEHPGTLLNMDNLAATYLRQGRWIEAEKLQLEVLQLRKKVLGKEHPDTLTSMNNLALIYSKQGRWTEAEKIEGERVVQSRSVFGDEHPSTLISMNNLATTYHRQGRYAEAEKIQVKVLQLQSRVQGEEHPDTLSSIGNLSLIYLEQGRRTEAEKMQLEVLQSRRRVMGDEHQDTLISMASLAFIYYEQGRWTEAEKIEVEVLKTSQRVLGAEHPDTLRRMYSLANTLMRLTRRAEAIQLMSECVQLQVRVLGAEHPDILSSSAALTEWQKPEEEEVASSMQNSDA